PWARKLQIPSSKIQEAPTSKSKMSLPDRRAASGCARAGGLSYRRRVGASDLEILWSLDLGAWCFAVRAFAIEPAIEFGSVIPHPRQRRARLASPTGSSCSAI